MADANVNMKFTGNADDAIRAIASLERKYDHLEQKMKHANQASKSMGKDGADALGDSIMRASTALGGMIGVGAALQQTMSGVAAEVKQFNSDVDQAWAKQRENLTKWAVQDMLPTDVLVSELPQITLSAKKTPVTDLAGAIDARRQLSSVGIDPADLTSGKALQTMLELKALSNSFGDAAEPTEVTAKSLTQFLSATGGGNKAADLKRVGSKIASLSADSAINVSDLGQLSQNAAVLTQFGLTESEQLAAYRTSFEVSGGAVGGTGIRNVVSRLGTAGTEKTRVEALETMGLTPADVAISKGGVTLTQALDKLRGGMVGMDEVTKNNSLKKLFGEEGSSTAGVLLSDTGRARYAAGLKRADNAAGEAESRVKIFEDSREATVRRSRIGKESSTMREALKGATWGEFGEFETERKTKAMEQARGQGARLLQGYANWIEGVGDWFHQSTGHSPESMMQMKPGTMIDQTQKQQMRELEKQTALLEKIANKPEQRQRVVNPKGNDE